MKKIITLLFVSLFVLTACEGPEGPPGLDAPVVEFFERTVNFNSGNNYAEPVSIPESIEVSGFDVVQVYILWGQTENGDDIWRALPQTVQMADGDLIYNFDYTIADVLLFMESLDFDLGTVDPAYTDNQTFRIAIIPSYEAAIMDLNDVSQVFKSSIKID
ncbi:hypothetical protein OOZ15_12815 [Galbibacter sp. EGI 63066]|uniref:hypothetical protein n=1 Tax=Galbibacter sp. EGI 63066 TaxID=2993559 RepID=UPI0022496E59|nr:hypothetical protein [Galbibacter sp. EGI 63066]MCX2680828.1 hypothetical protein [Galbibacter sp. EGI 63066]